MKILIVRMCSNVESIKNYNYQEIGLAKALIKKGNICDIVLCTNKKSYEENIKIDDDKIIHLYYVRATKILKNIIYDKELYDIAQGYDVIQTVEYDQIGNELLRRKFPDKIVVYHGPYESKYTRGYNLKCVLSDIYYIFHKKYKSIPFLAKSNLAAEFLKNKGCNNITTVKVGLDIQRFEKDNKPDKLVQEILREKKETKYLLYIGKIEDRRNILFLIDILEELKNREEDVKLVLVGKGNQEYINKCKKYAESKNVMNNIIYHSSISQDNIKYLYKSCDIFLLPTKYEIFGMVLLEAMYFGLPTITTLNGGSSTIVENEVDGIICDLQKEQWVEYILKLLKNEEYRKTISKNCQNKILNNYTWDKLVDKFIKCYQERKGI